MLGGDMAVAHFATATPPLPIAERDVATCSRTGVHRLSHTNPHISHTLSTNYPQKRPTARGIASRGWSFNTSQSCAHRHQTHATVNRLGPARHKRNVRWRAALRAIDLHGQTRLMQSFIAALVAAFFASFGPVPQMVADEPRLFSRIPQKLLPAVNADEPLVRKVHNDCTSLFCIENLQCRLLI